MNTLTTTTTNDGNEISVEEVEKNPDFLQMIHDDNSAVAELFFQYSQVEDDDEKRKIFEQIKNSLTIHGEIGEELLYPLVVEVAESDEDKEEAKELVAEVEAGNYIASLILDELEVTDTNDVYFDAKMKILCKLVKELVKKEEKEMFETLQASDIDFGDLVEEAESMKSASETKASRKNAGAAKKTKAKSKPTKSLKPVKNAKKLAGAKKTSSSSLSKKTATAGAKKKKKSR